VRVDRGDVPYGILVDGRPIDAAHRSGLNRDGILYVNVVRAVKTFNGLLTFGRGGLIRVSIGTRSMRFTIGSRTAVLDGATMRLAGAPFRLSGDTYVPLAPIATLGGAKLTVNRHLHQAALNLGAGEGFAQPAPTSSEQSELQPSPTQALTFATSVSSELDGLRARVDIDNTTSKPYTIDFPTDAQIVFVVSKNGSEVWNSSPGEHPPHPSSLTIEALGSKTVTGTLPAIARLGPGRYTLRVRLFTAVPLDMAPVSLGVTAPPTATN
jgi:hypothetical protein